MAKINVFEKGNKVYLEFTGMCGYNHIFTPDNYEGQVKYKIDVHPNPDEMESIKELLEEYTDKVLEYWVANTPKNKEKLAKVPKPLPVPVMDAEKGHKDIGTPFLQPRSGFRPTFMVGQTGAVYSKKRDNLEESNKFRYIKTGSPVRIMCELYPYTSFGGGVALRLTTITVNSEDDTALNGGDGDSESKIDPVVV